MELRRQFGLLLVKLLLIVAAKQTTGQTAVPSTTCPPGFTGSGNCRDMNECSATPYPCLTGALCVNTLGSYACYCNGTQVGDGETKCEEIPRTTLPPATGFSLSTDTVLSISVFAGVLLVIANLGFYCALRRPLQTHYKRYTNWRFFHPECHVNGETVAVRRERFIDGTRVLAARTQEAYRYMGVQTNSLPPLHQYPTPETSPSTQNNSVSTYAAPFSVPASTLTSTYMPPEFDHLPEVSVNHPKSPFYTRPFKDANQPSTKSTKSDKGNLGFLSMLRSPRPKNRERSRSSKRVPPPVPSTEPPRLSMEQPEPPTLLSTEPPAFTIDSPGAFQQRSVSLRIDPREKPRNISLAPPDKHGIRHHSGSMSLRSPSPSANPSPRPMRSRTSSSYREGSSSSMHPQQFFAGGHGKRMSDPMRCDMSAADRPCTAPGSLECPNEHFGGAAFSLQASDIRGSRFDLNAIDDNNDYTSHYNMDINPSSYKSQPEWE